MSTLYGPWLLALTRTGQLGHAVRAMETRQDFLGYQSWCGRVFVPQTRTHGSWFGRDQDVLVCSVCFDGVKAHSLFDGVRAEDLT